MRYKSIFKAAYLIIPFCVTSSTSAEIFEEVHDYDVDGCDIESADFNNDGLEDFAVVEYIAGDYYYEVFLSNGDCSFARQNSVFVDTSEVSQLLTGDFNEDASEDFLFMSLNNTWLYFGDGTGSFTLDDTFPWSLCKGCIGDINNDGHLDIVGIPIDSWTWYEAYGDSVVVMLGDGTGDFTKGWVYEDYHLSSCQLAYFGDPDTDTILDMCVPYCEGFLVFQGVGNGTFSDPEYYAPSYCYEYMLYSTSGDFDEDGYIDIAVSMGDAGMSSPSTFVFLNQQDSTFVQVPDYEGYFHGACGEKIATADLDLDGHLDLSVAGMCAGSIAGYGNGFFNLNERLSINPGVNFVFIDMDLDGDLDLADRLGYIYRNTTINLGCEGHESGPIYDLVLDVLPNSFYAFVSIQVSGFSDVGGNIQIFDLSGRLVAELEPVSGKGEAVFQWNGVSSSGSELPSGIYTARLYFGNTVTATTLLKLK